MKIAILADIHGNLEALTAVCADLDSRQVERVVCLGDNVGYGPDPEAVTRLVRTRGFLCVLGNHEFALADKRARRWLNFQAEENSIATRKMLSADSLKYYAALPMSLCLANGHFVHGYPPASPFKYLNRQNDEKILRVFATLPSQLFFVGHTHRLLMVSSAQGLIAREQLFEGVASLDPAAKYLFSAGSVGQPRDGDPRAKYLLWDTDQGTVAVRCVAYDAASTKKKIIGLGFPEIYAKRLG